MAVYFWLRVKGGHCLVKGMGPVKVFLVGLYEVGVLFEALLGGERKREVGGAKRTRSGARWMKGGDETRGGLHSSKCYRMMIILSLNRMLNDQPSYFASSRSRPRRKNYNYNEPEPAADFSFERRPTETDRTSKGSKIEALSESINNLLGRVRKPHVSLLDRDAEKDRREDWERKDRVERNERRDNIQREKEPERERFVSFGQQEVAEKKRDEPTVTENVSRRRAYSYANTENQPPTRTLRTPQPEQTPQRQPQDSRTSTPFQLLELPLPPTPQPPATDHPVPVPATPSATAQQIESEWVRKAKIFEKSRQLDAKIMQIRTKISQDSPVKAETRRRQIEEMFTVKKPAQPLAIRKLAMGLAELVELDIRLRPLRESLSVSPPNVWPKLKEALRSHGIHREDAELRDALAVSIHEKNPFGGRPEPLGLNQEKDLARLFASAEEQWILIEGGVTKDDLEREGFSASSIDLHRRGAISIEDLTCFLNMQAQRFYRSRDLGGLFRRLLQLEGRSLEQLAEGLSYVAFLDRLAK